MAKPIDLKTLTEEERGILKKAIPLLREKDTYYWEKNDFKELYDEWLKKTNNQFVDGGFEQFKLALAITNGIEECKKEDICICNSPHVTQMGLGKCVRTTLPDASYYELYRTLREMYLKLAIAKQLHEDCAKTHAKNTSPDK